MSATSDRLLSVLQHELQQAESWATEHLQEDQLKAFRYYLGKPMGNEVKGRSQVVSWDVFEAIESALPSFLEPFFSSEHIGVFSPRGPEDEAYADQATDYINHIIKARNPGFNIFSTWIKDALMSKVGVVRADWEKEEPKRLQYRGLTDDQFLALASDEAVQIVEKTSKPVPGMPAMNEAQTIQMGGQVPMLHDVVAIRSMPGCVEITNVRPENFVITAGVGSMERVRLIGEWVVYTRSELKEAGFKQAATVDSYDESAMLATDLQMLRDDASDLNDNAADEALEEVRLFKGYVRCDRNGDGIAEWRRVLIGGGEDPILEDEEADEHNYAVLSPILIPHRIIGMSYADVAVPIQDIKTALTRQYLDSLYIANRPRTYVNLQAGVSLDDLLSERIGGIIRGNGPAQNAVQPLITTAVSRDALEGLQLADNMRETRLGVPKFNPGVEPDALHKAPTATAVRSFNSLVDKRQKMVLRTFAETGIKDLFRLVLRLVTEYQEIPDLVRLRGQFVPFDPRGWTPDMDVIIEVGVGTSDETETMMLLQQFGQYMTWAQQVGAVQPRNVYEFGKALAKNARLKGAAEKFLTDPQTVQPQQPPPDPKIVTKQMELQADAQKFQAQTAVDERRAQMDAQMQAEIDRNRQEMEARQKTLEMQQEAQLEQMRIASNERIKAAEMEFERWKVEFQASHATSMEQSRQAAQAPATADQSQAMEPLLGLLQQVVEYIAAPPRITDRGPNGEPLVIEKGSRRFAVDRQGGQITGASPIQ